MSKYRVLVVDDEQSIRRVLAISLEADGYEVIEAGRGEEAVTMAAMHAPQLMILDLSMPDIDGIEVLRRVRNWTDIPILILTVRDSERDKVALLDAGADDYLTKPFSVPELLARVRVALRHHAPTTSSSLFQNGTLEIDFANRTVSNAGKEIRLTSTEFNLLALLARHVGKLVTQRHLLQEVWGPGSTDQTHYLRVFIGQLRKKLEIDPNRPRLLLTEPGIGYRMSILDS